MVRVPVYTPAGKFGSGARLILNVIESLLVPVLLYPRIGTDDNSRPALAPPKATVFVRAANAPPLSEI